MSWHFLQEQEEASWEANSLDGAPSALLSLMPTASESCSPDSGTDSCRDSRSGTMCRPSTASLGADASMSLAADFHARTSAPPARAQALKASEAGCGERWRESLAKLDPATHSWKTAQCSLFGEGYESLATLPPWGIAANGELWELATPPRLTSATECGFLPTVQKSDSKGTGKTRYVGSPQMRHGKAIEGLRMSLTDPQYIHPDFAEWMMGWPIGWSECLPLATDRFQQWLRSHGVCLEGQSDET